MPKKPFSVRLDEATHGLLQARADELGVPASQLVNRYVKEGLRMDMHPRITFVSGAAGRRAELVGHPRLQITDLIQTWQLTEKHTADTARYFEISDEEVLAAVRYYAAFRSEVDKAVREKLEAQDRLEQVLRRRQRAGV